MTAGVVTPVLWIVARVVVARRIVAGYRILVQRRKGARGEDGAR